MSTLGTIPRNAAIALLVTSWGFVAGAADLYWDPNGGTAGTGGTGNWNLSDPFWRLGSDTGTLQSWPGSASDVAFFGGSAGTVTVSSAGVQAGGLNFSTTGYTIAASGGNSLTLVGPATVTTGSGVAATMNASLGGSAGLTKAGAGSFTVAAGSAAYSGTTTVSAGTLQLDYAGGSVPAPNSTAASIASDATLAYFLASGTTFQNIATTISGSGTLRFGQASELVLNGGGLRLAGTNSFSGTIEIGENVALIANSAGALQGKPAVVFTGSVGRLGIADTASGSVIGSLSGAAGSIDGSSGTINTPRSLTIEQNSTSSFGGTIEDGTNGRTISLTKSGSGTLTLSGNNTYSGTTTVSAGTLQLNYVGGSVPAANSTAQEIASDATLTYFLASLSGSEFGEFENATTNISGSGTLRFDQAGGLDFNAGGLRLAGTNSFSGTIEIGENVALIANSAGALQGKPAVVFTGSVGRLAIADTASGSVIGSLSGAAGLIDGGSGTFNTPRSLTIEQNSTSSFGGTIEDGTNGRTISLTKSGTGTLTLTGNNTYSGATTVSAGTLQLNYAGGSVPAVNSTAKAIASDATLAYFLASGTGYENVTTNISGSGTLRFDQDGGLTFNLGGLRLAGTNSFSGTIEIGENAALVANSAGALQGKPAVVFTGSVGRLAIADTASGSVIGSLSGAAGSIDGSSGTNNTPRSLTIEQNSTSSFGGTIEDGTNGRMISLTKSGTGTLTLSGNNTYAGGTTVSGGTLALASAGSLTGAGTISIAAAGTFDVTALAGGFTLGAGQAIGGDGGILGSILFDTGSSLVFSETETLALSSGTASFFAGTAGSRFGIDDLLGISASTTAGTYTLISGTVDTTNLDNLGAANAYALGSGVTAYFQEGSLQVVVVPEPAGLALAGLGSVAAAWAIRRRRFPVSAA